MNGISLLLVWASLGVVYSWRAGVDGQQEYVLQVEPEIIQTLPTIVEGIQSDVPAEAGNVQRLCIVVLPKGGTAATHSFAAEERFRQLALTAGRYASNDPALASDSQPTILWPSRTNPEQTYGISVGWQPDIKGSLQYFVQIDPTLLRTLAVGDELYVPIDPAAGRPARFIVTAGKEQLPRTPAPQTQFAQGNTPFSPLAGGSNRNRYPGVTGSGAIAPGATGLGLSDAPATSWSHSPTGGLATDHSRQARPNSTFPRAAATDPQNSSLWSSGGNSYAPQTGAALNPPASSYGDYGAGQPPANLYPSSSAQFSGGRAYGTTPPATSNNFDQYGNPSATSRDLANSTHYPPQAGNQQQATSQILRNGTQQQPFDTRLAGGSSLPAGANVLGATSTMQPGTLPPGTQQPNQEKPWGPLLFVSFALFFSIGGNLYLAYTALEFHSRYRNAIERLRSAARSA